MKKLLLSVAFAATCFFGVQAQIEINDVDLPELEGGSLIPLFQGANGTYQIQGQNLPHANGSLTSVDINATLVASVDETYANDLTIIVTAGPQIQSAADILLQIGGFSTFTQNKFDWPCGADCDSDDPGTVVFGEVSQFTALDFSNSTYVMWIGNGYVNNSDPDSITNTGTWTINELTFEGVNPGQGGSSSIEANTAISAVAFPNPATDLLTVSVEGDEVVAVSVISMDGKVVSTVEGSVAQVAELTAGMYIYEATTASGMVVRNAFIKK